MVARWEDFPHGADVGIRGFGATPEDAFVQAALALTAVITDAEVRSEEAARAGFACDLPCGDGR
jgi:SHS2 domain-containing protein